MSRKSLPTKAAMPAHLGVELPLKLFGKFVEGLRRGKDLSQSVFATRIHVIDRRLKASQTLIARIENGMQEPRPELIQAMAQVLEIPKLELVGKLVESKYDIQPTLLSFLHRRPKTLDDLAEWESELSELWIVTTVYVDPINKAFENSVEKIIGRGGTVTFFIPKKEVEEFLLWRSGLFPHLDDKSLMPVPFGVSEEAFMATAFSIANASNLGQRDKPPPEGYLILNNAEAEPEFAIEMYPAELRNRIVRLRRLRGMHEIGYPERDTNNEV